jgi:hypothetical protein
VIDGMRNIVGYWEEALNKVSRSQVNKTLHIVKKSSTSYQYRGIELSSFSCDMLYVVILYFLGHAGPSPGAPTPPSLCQYSVLSPCPRSASLNVALRIHVQLPRSGREKLIKHGHRSSSAFGNFCLSVVDSSLCYSYIDRSEQ